MIFDFFPYLISSFPSLSLSFSARPFVSPCLLFLGSFISNLFFCLYSCFFLSSQSSVSSPFSFIPQLLFIFSSSAFCPCLRSFLSSSSSHFLSLCPPPLSPPLPPPVTWFLLILSRQLLSHTSSRSYCSIWWSGRGSRSSSVAQDQRTSPGHVRLISGLSGLVLTGGSRAARGVWVVDARCSVGGARVEGAC